MTHEIFFALVFAFAAIVILCAAEWFASSLRKQDEDVMIEQLNKAIAGAREADHDRRL